MDNNTLMQISLYEHECAFCSTPVFNHLKDKGIDMSKMDEDQGEVFVSAKMKLTIDGAFTDSTKTTEADVIKMSFNIDIIPSIEIEEAWFSVELNRDNVIFLKNYLQAYLDCYTEHEYTS